MCLGLVSSCESLLLRSSLPLVVYLHSVLHLFIIPCRRDYPDTENFSLDSSKSALVARQQYKVNGENRRSPLGCIYPELSPVRGSILNTQNVFLSKTDKSTLCPTKKVGACPSWFWGTSSTHSPYSPIVSVGRYLTP